MSEIRKTWEEIDQISKSGKAKEVFKVGDCKLFSYNGSFYTAVVADFDHDDLSDGFGKAGISFAVSRCVEQRVLFNGHKGIGIWRCSDIFPYLNEFVIKGIDQKLAAVIKPVNKEAGSKQHSPETEMVSSKLWLFSEKEVFGERKLSAAEEGYQYPYFADVENRKKVIQFWDEAEKAINVPSIWWLRSSYKDITGHFCFVDKNGDVDFSWYANHPYGIVFGFAI